jgi:hypothetical protein
MRNAGIKSIKTTDLDVVRTNPSSFTWGDVQKIHDVGTRYTIVEYVDNYNRTFFHVYLDGRSLLVLTLDLAGPNGQDTVMIVTTGRVIKINAGDLYLERTSEAPGIVVVTDKRGGRIVLPANDDDSERFISCFRRAIAEDVGYRKQECEGPGVSLPEYRQCTRPPAGWYCTRGVHTDGPCAALPKKNT